MSHVTASKLQLLAVLAASAILYWLLAYVGMAISPGNNAPHWFLPAASRLVRFYSWLHLNTWAGLAIASAPLAAVIAWFFPRRHLAFAAGVVLLGAIGPLLLQSLPSLALELRPGTVSLAADLLKFLVTLPALTFLFAQLATEVREMHTKSRNLR